MSRSRPASNPISFHKHTKQYYVTRGGKRIYLGSDKEQALEKYHRLGLGLQLTAVEETAPNPLISAKELANRFIAAQRANWRNPEATLKCYTGWLGRFLRDHPRLMASALTVEAFADWKLSLKERNYSPESINHYLKSGKKSGPGGSRLNFFFGPGWLFWRELSKKSSSACCLIR